VIDYREVVVVAIDPLITNSPPEWRMRMRLKLRIGRIKRDTMARQVDRLLIAALEMLLVMVAGQLLVLSRLLLLMVLLLLLILVAVLLLLLLVLTLGADMYSIQRSSAVNPRMLECQDPDRLKRPGLLDPDRWRMLLVLVPVTDPGIMKKEVLGLENPGIMKGG
jgi:hypothetical protein